MASAVDSKAASPTSVRKQVIGTESLTKQQPKVVVVSESDDEHVISPIVVLRKRSDVRRYEKSEECFILDFDPFEVELVNVEKQIDDDIVLISEKGQVACRDYPHSRHLCLKFPFDETPHESYCNLCYCYVCDAAAPCKYWKLPAYGHCDASDRLDDWKGMRDLTIRMAKLNPNQDEN